MLAEKLSLTSLLFHRIEVKKETEQLSQSVVGTHNKFKMKLTNSTKRQQYCSNRLDPTIFISNGKSYVENGNKKQMTCYFQLIVFIKVI